MLKLFERDRHKPWLSKHVDKMGMNTRALLMDMILDIDVIEL